MLVDYRTTSEMLESDDYQNIFLMLYNQEYVVIILMIYIMHTGRV